MRRVSSLDDALHPEVSIDGGCADLPYYRPKNVRQERS